MKSITMRTLLGLLIFVMVPKTESYVPNIRKTCRGTVADIVFVLDSSSSIWREDFEKQLNFVKYMIEPLDIGKGPNQVRIGIQTFSDKSSIHIALNNFLDKVNLLWEIDQIPQIIGNANLGNALSDMRNIMFTERNGARPGVRRVAIILTGGATQDHHKNMALREAKASRDANIELFVVGIGYFINKQHLEEIASKPHNKFLLLSDTYHSLDKITEGLMSRICKANIREICRGKVADIVFVLDSSSSIWSEDFEKQLNFVKYMIEPLDIGKGPNQVRIGIETFSDEASIHINLNEYFKRINLLEEINQIPQITGNTSLGNALREMRNVMFTQHHGARPGVRDVAIILTDGVSQDQDLALREAKASRDANIDLFVVGIGNYTSEAHLAAIASKPKHKYLFFAPSYETLNRIRDDVIRQTCEIVCNTGKTEVVFMINNNHFGQQKTNIILNTCIKLMKEVEMYSDVSFGLMFDNCHHNLDRPVGKLTGYSHLKREYSDYQFGPFVSLIKKLQNRVFHSRFFGARRIGLIFIDKTIDLNRWDIQAEARRLSFEYIELFAVIIGNIDETLIVNSLVPEQHIIRISSYDQLIHDLPILFTNLLCKPLTP